jgi:hypothetical protein
VVLQLRRAFGWQSRRVSRSQGGRWEYRFTGLSVHNGLLGIGTMQEDSAAATRPAVRNDYVRVHDGFTAGVNVNLWRERPERYTVADFGLHRVNLLSKGVSFGYVGIIGVVPLWLPTLLLAWPLGARYRDLWREAKQLKRAQQGLCPMCGYDLHGTRERCPECGAKRTETWPTTA